MRWPWQKQPALPAPDYSAVLERIEKRLGGIEVVQTEILKQVRPPPPPSRNVPGVGAVGNHETKYKIG